MVKDAGGALRAEADKNLQGAQSGFRFFSNSETKYEDAADGYEKAGRAYREDKQYKDSALMFEKASSVRGEKLMDNFGMASMLFEAYKSHSKCDPNDAARVLRQAITPLATSGHASQAGKRQEELAALYERELDDKPKAIAEYEGAAQRFDDEKQAVTANKNFLKAADLAALEGDYQKAVKYYEQVAKSSIDNNLMRFSVKDYLLKAGICHMASKDMITTNRALESYRELDPGFAQQREHQLLVDLTQAVEEGDGEAFSDKLFQYDQMSKLDSWKTSILVRIKNDIGEAEEDFS